MLGPGLLSSSASSVGIASPSPSSSHPPAAPPSCPGLSHSVSSSESCTSSAVLHVTCGSIGQKNALPGETHPTFEILSVRIERPTCEKQQDRESVWYLSWSILTPRGTLRHLSHMSHMAHSCARS
eukprot:320435-Rhodomonas_salina.1